MGKRDFGAVRQLPSGRWQARYRNNDGVLATAPATFATRALASAFLAQAQADRSRGVWVDPPAGSVPFGEYAASWLAQWVDLRPRTRRAVRRPAAPATTRRVRERVTAG